MASSGGEHPQRIGEKEECEPVAVREERQIVEVEPDDHVLMSVVFPVLKELRPHLSEETFASIYSLGHGQGLRFSAVLRDGEEGSKECLAVAGWRLLDCASLIRVLFVEDLVTGSAVRSTGVGKSLLGYLERKARDAGCRKLTLDSGTHRAGAHRFYFREGLSIAAYHFEKDLAPPQST